MDNRSYPRTPTDSFCRARFRIGERDCKGIGIADLSLGGCRIRMPAADAPGLQAQATLEGWRFSHPALPKDAIEAWVAWCRAPAGPKDRFLEAGVRFQELPAAYANGLGNFLTYVARPSGPELDFSGMP